MGDPHDLINEIYYKKKYPSMVNTFSKFQLLLSSALNYYFNFCFTYFPPSLKFGMNPQEGVNFPFCQKHFKIMLHLVPFQNKVAEIRVEYLGRQFLDPCSSTHAPPLKIVCVGGGVLAPLMI